MAMAKYPAECYDFIRRRHVEIKRRRRRQSVLVARVSESIDTIKYRTEASPTVMKWGSHSMWGWKTLSHEAGKIILVHCKVNDDFHL